jgi:TldD protein
VKGVGEVAWATPIKKDWRTVPVKEKAEMLIAANKAGLDAGASFMTANLFQVNQQKYFASTDGSYIDQDIHRLWAPLTATAVDKATGKFRSRAGLALAGRHGLRILRRRPEHKIQAAGGVTTLYKGGYDIVEEARNAGRQAREKLTAPGRRAGQVRPGAGAGNLFLTIHESVGHPTELDRVLGYEANYAGTSFARWTSGRPRNSSSAPTSSTSSPTRPRPVRWARSATTTKAWQAKRWDIIKDGILVNYQATRDQAHIIGEKESHGCSYADSWSSVQFQRMPNVSLAAGKAR